MLAVSPTLLTRFQLASTALTVTLRGVPAVWANGVPSLPVVVPGAAVSPGVSNCSLAKVLALTEMAGLVEDGYDGWVESEAVTGALPPGLSVPLRFLVPPTSAPFAGT